MAVTYLFEEVAQQYAAAQGDHGQGGHGYQIWAFDEVDNHLDFIGFIGALMFDHWVDYYTSTGAIVLLKELKDKEESKNAN